jgi:signal transduction histidine kinase
MTIAARFSPSPGQPGIGLSGLIPDSRARAAVSLAGLGVSLWSAADGLPHRPGLAPLAALAVAGAAWLVLAAVNRGPLVPVAVAVLGAAGGVIAVTDKSGLIFAGVSAGLAAVTFDLLGAAVLTAAGPAAFAGAAAAAGTLPGRLLAVVTACLAGMVAGATRREAVQRARQATLVATAKQRAEVAREQAELAQERIRLGRELHDVLAHTLGALSI